MKYSKAVGCEVVTVLMFGAAMAAPRVQVPCTEGYRTDRLTRTIVAPREAVDLQGTWCDADGWVMCGGDGGDGASCARGERQGRVLQGMPAGLEGRLLREHPPVGRDVGLRAADERRHYGHTALIAGIMGLTS